MRQEERSFCISFSSLRRQVTRKEQRRAKREREREREREPSPRCIIRADRSNKVLHAYIEIYDETDINIV